MGLFDYQFNPYQGGLLGDLGVNDLTSLIRSYGGYQPQHQLSGAEPSEVWAGRPPSMSGAEPSEVWGGPQTASVPMPPQRPQMPSGPMFSGDGSQSSMGGGYGGGAFAPQAGAMPQSAMQTQMPPQAQNAMAQAPQSPPQSSPGFGGHIAAGLNSFLGNLHNGPIAAIAGGLGGVSTGQRNDPYGLQQKQQRAMYESLAPKLGHAGAVAAMSNPKILEEWAKREFAPYSFGQQGGVVYNQDPRTGTASPQMSVPQFHALPQGSAAVAFDPMGQRGGQGGAAPGMTTLQPAGPNFDHASNLRKEVTALPEVKRYSEALPIYRSMVKSHGKDSAAADLDFVYGVAKIFDPDSVVREGEMKLVGKAQSIPEDVQGFIKRAAFGEGRLTPEARRRILEVADTRMNELKGSYGERTAAYPGIAKRFQVNPDDVMPQLQGHPELPPAAAPPPAPSSAGPVEGMTATNPKTKQKVIFKGGQWVPVK